MYRQRPVTLLDSLDIGWSLPDSLALMRAFALSSFYDVIRIDLAGHERKGTVPVSQYATCAARSKRNLVARVHLCNRRRHGRLHRTLPGTRPTNSGIDGVVERSLFSMLLARRRSHFTKSRICFAPTEKCSLRKGLRCSLLML